MAKKGMQQERNLVRYLNNKGYTAVRVAGSGAGTKRPTPDILASDGNKCYAIELKSSSKDLIYIDKNQVNGLKEFSYSFGAIPLLCVNFTYMDYYFISINRLTLSKGLNYKISRQEAKNNKISFNF